MQQCPSHHKMIKSTANEIHACLIILCKQTESGKYQTRMSNILLSVKNTKQNVASQLCLHKTKITLDLGVPYFNQSELFPFFNQTRTFTLSGAKAAPLLGRRGGALIDRHGFLVAFAARYLSMHLVGQISQQTHTVLYQLQRQRKSTLQ